MIRGSFRPGDHRTPMKGKEGESRIWGSKRLRPQCLSDRVQSSRAPDCPLVDSQVEKWLGPAALTIFSLRLGPLLERWGSSLQQSGQSLLAEGSMRHTSVAALHARGHLSIKEEPGLEPSVLIPGLLFCLLYIEIHQIIDYHQIVCNYAFDCMG